MPLTKSEFDRWKAQQEEAAAKIADTPRVDRLCRIDCGGYLRFTANADGFGPESTRALYEMLRAWYGEETMTEKAKAVIEAADAIATADGILQRDVWDHFVRTVDAYRAEQKQ